MTERKKYFILMLVLSTLIAVVVIRGAMMLYSYSSGYEYIEGIVESARCKGAISWKGSDHIEIVVASDSQRKNFSYALSCTKFDRDRIEGSSAVVSYDHLGEIMSLNYDGTETLSQSRSKFARAVSFGVIGPFLLACLYLVRRKYRSLNA